MTKTVTLNLSPAFVHKVSVALESGKDAAKRDFVFTANDVVNLDERVLAWVIAAGLSRIPSVKLNNVPVDDGAKAEAFDTMATALRAGDYPESFKPKRRGHGGAATTDPVTKELANLAEAEIMSRLDVKTRKALADHERGKAYVHVMRSGAVAQNVNALVEWADGKAAALKLRDRAEKIVNARDVPEDASDDIDI